MLYTAAYVELEFSKPINTGTAAATVSGRFQVPANFAAYSDGVTTIPLKAVVLSDTRVALAFSAVLQPAFAADAPPQKSRLTGVIAAELSRFPSRSGFYAKNLTTGEEASFNEED